MKAASNLETEPDIFKDREAIRKLAMDSGYNLAGFAPVELNLEDRHNYIEFVRRSHHGSMQWFRRYLDLRLNPAGVFPQAKCVMVLGSLYRLPRFEDIIKKSKIKISRYAAGRDYHKILRKKGVNLLKEIQKIFPEAAGRITVDSAPVAEKTLARMAGIGWQGKNTNIIHPEIGSYFFLSVLFLNLPLPPDESQKDRCLTCRKCLDACPTQALEPYRIDARKCISYLTIELKSRIEEKFQNKLSGWVFGCDICQEVCPFNNKKSALDPEIIPEFFLRDSVLPLMNEEINVEDEFLKAAAGSALGRISYEKFIENKKTAFDYFPTI